MDGLVADGMQHYLEALLVVEGHGVIQVILIPERNSGAATHIGLRHGRGFGVHRTIEETLDGAELEQGTAKAVAKLAVVGQVVGGERTLQLMVSGKSALVGQDQRGE